MILVRTHVVRLGQISKDYAIDVTLQEVKDTLAVKFWKIRLVIRVHSDCVCSACLQFDGSLNLASWLRFQIQIELLHRPDSGQSWVRVLSIIHRLVVKVPNRHFVYEADLSSVVWVLQVNCEHRQLVIGFEVRPFEDLQVYWQ
jgi:hypothetical protein